VGLVCLIEQETQTRLTRAATGMALALAFALNAGALGYALSQL
jgi:hypothetical protein